MRKVLVPLILALVFGVGHANADDKQVKKIPVDSANITQVRAIPNAYELNVSHGDTSNPYYNFVLSSQKGARQGGFAATVDGLVARVNDKLSGKVGKKPELPYVLIYRQQQNLGDSLTTPELSQLMGGLERDSVFLFVPKTRDDYVF